MGDLNGTRRANLLGVRRVQFLTIVIGGTFSKILNATVPGPFIATKISPVVKGGFGSRNPGEVAGKGAATKDFAAGILFLGSLVVVSLDHSSLISPVILAASDSEGLGWGGDVFDLVRVRRAGLDD